MNNYQLTIKDRNFNVVIIRKHVKNINLRVTPQKEIFVSAHDTIPENIITQYIQKKADWIEKKVIYFEQFNIPENRKTYENGESFLYLGKQYRIKVIKKKLNEIKLLGKFLTIFVSCNIDINYKKQLVEKWYRDKSDKHFNIILNNQYPKLGKYGYSKPDLFIKKMKTRWGSYSQRTNSLYVNIDLIKTPKYCIEYVILHELVHIRFQKHDRNFYNYLTVLMQDWKMRKAYLDEFVYKIL